MVFSSPLFMFAFLAVVLLGALIFSGNKQNAFLLAASLLFYWWGETSYGWLLGVSILFNYVAGLDVGVGTRGRQVLAVAIAANLALLAWFKYASFLSANLSDVLV